MKKFLISAGLALASVAPVLAEAATPSDDISPIITPYITAAKTAGLAILTAGVIILGCFFMWRVAKKALGKTA